MMQKHLNSSAEYSKKITPCTTVPTSPNSESISLDPAWNSKCFLIKNYEIKLFTLFEHIGKIANDLSRRFASIQRKTEKNQEKSRTSRNDRTVNSLKSHTEENPHLIDDLNALNLELLKRVEYLELRNKTEKQELKEIQEKIDEGTVIHQFSNKSISDINRSLVKLYGVKDEKLKIYQFIQLEKQKAFETEKLVKNALNSLSQQKTFYSKKQQILHQKKSKILEKHSNVENLKIKVFKEKFSNERLFNRSKELNFAVSQLLKSHQTVLDRVKQKILNMETWAEKIQVQEKFLKLKKEKIRNESKFIFERSSQIFELLKMLEGKNIEMDREVQVLESRTKKIQDEIWSIRETKDCKEEKSLVEVDQIKD